MAKAGDAYVQVHGDLSSLNKALATAFGGSKLGALGKKAGLAVGVGLAGGLAAAIGKGLFDLGAKFDTEFDKIRVGTGKTGAALDALEGDFKAVLQSVPAEFGLVGDAISFLNSRLGLTGKPLQKLAKQMVQLSDITETDLGTNMENLTRVFADFGVTTDQQTASVDRLFRLAQATGTNVAELASNMVKFGSPLRQLGFDFDSTATLFAKFQKEGVNIRTALPGLRLALGEFAEAGKDPAKALRELFKQIEATGSVQEAYRLQIGDMGSVLQIFGKRAGSDLVQAIKEGRFEFADLIKVMKDGSDTVGQAEEDTRDFAQQWTLLKNRVFVGLEPIANKVFDTIGDGMERLATADFGEIGADLGIKLDLGDSQKSIDDATRNIREIFDSKLVRFLTGQYAANLKGAAKRAFGGIAQAIRGELAVISGVLKLINDLLHLRFAKAWDDVKQIFRGGVNIAVGTLRTMTAPVRELASRIGAALAPPFRGAWARTKDIFSSGVRGALGVLRGMAGTVADIGARIGSALKRSIEVRVGAIGGAFRLLRRVAEGSFGGIRTAVQWVIDKVRDLLDLIPRIKFPKLPDLNPFAKGGVVKGGIALVGEEGPELVKYAGKTGLVGVAGPEIRELPVGTRVYSHPETKRKLAPVIQKVSRVLDGKRLPGLEGIQQFAKGGVVKPVTELRKPITKGSRIVEKDTGRKGVVERVEPDAYRVHFDGAEMSVLVEKPWVEPEIRGRGTGASRRVVRGSAGGLQPAARYLASTMRQKFGLSVSPQGGVRPGDSGSFHSVGKAVDLVGSKMRQGAEWVKTSGLYKTLLEGIHNPNLSTDSGKMVSSGFWGAQTWAGHKDHVHLAANTITQQAKEGLTKGTDGAGGPKRTRRITGTLSVGQMVTLSKRAGFPDPALAAAVGYAESRGKVGAVGDGGDSLGLWQINTPAHPKYDHSKLQGDALYNAKAALQISKKGKSWQPWTQFRTGAYKPFLGRKGQPLPKGTTKGTPSGSSKADYLAMKLHDAESDTPADPKDDIRWINRALRYWRGVRKRNKTAGNHARASDALGNIDDLKAKKTTIREDLSDENLFTLGELTEIGKGPNAFKIGGLQTTLDNIGLEKANASLTAPADNDDSLGALKASLQDDIAAANRRVGFWTGLKTLTDGFLQPKVGSTGAFDPTKEQSKQLSRTKNQAERIALLNRFQQQAKGTWIEGTIRQKIEATEGLGGAKDELRSLLAEINKPAETDTALASNAKEEIRAFMAAIGDLNKTFGSNFKPLQSFADGGIIQGPRGKKVVIEGHGGEAIINEDGNLTVTIDPKQLKEMAERSQVVNKYIDARATFATVPADPHTYSRNVKHELDAI